MTEVGSRGKNVDMLGKEVSNACRRFRAQGLRLSGDTACGYCGAQPLAKNGLRPQKCEFA